LDQAKDSGENINMPHIDNYSVNIKSTAVDGGVWTKSPTLLEKKEQLAQHLEAPIYLR